MIDAAFFNHPSGGLTCISFDDCNPPQIAVMKNGETVAHFEDIVIDWSKVDASLLKELVGKE